MNLPDLYQQFLVDLHNTRWFEYAAVFAGIASVWFSRLENVLVYPFGLLNTIIYIFLSYDGGLLGEASVNLYYTVMNIYGWVIWTRKDHANHYVLSVSGSTQKEWMQQLAFFAAIYSLIFVVLTYLKKDFAPGAIPWADAFASATAFTGMWLMTRKKVESWYWWIATNISSIPLYFVKHYVFTSAYYVVLLAISISGLMAWKKSAALKTN